MPENQPDPADYPRMMYHHRLPWVIIQNETEEKALGPEWSRTPGGNPPNATAAKPKRGRPRRLDSLGTSHGNRQ